MEEVPDNLKYPRIVYFLRNCRSEPEIIELSLKEMWINYINVKFKGYELYSTCYPADDKNHILTVNVFLDSINVANKTDLLKKKEKIEKLKSFVKWYMF